MLEQAYLRLGDDRPDTVEVDFKSCTAYTPTKRLESAARTVG